MMRAAVVKWKSAELLINIFTVNIFHIFLSNNIQKLSPFCLRENKYIIEMESDIK